MVKCMNLFSCFFFPLILTVLESFKDVLLSGHNVLKRELWESIYEETELEKTVGKA